MITGIVVTAGREAVVRFFVRGIEGRLTEVEAVLDTGFTDYLTLPSALITALGLPYQYDDKIVMSNGETATCAVHEGVVLWNGQERTVPIQAGEGDALIGMSLLLDHLLTLPVRDGATLTITPLPSSA